MIYIIIKAPDFDPKNLYKNEASIVYDKDGNILKKTDVIPPEATITVKANSAFFKWNQISGGITAILSAISTALSIYMISRSL